MALSPSATYRQRHRIVAKAAKIRNIGIVAAISRGGIMANNGARITHARVASRPQQRGAMRRACAYHAKRVALARVLNAWQAA